MTLIYGSNSTTQSHNKTTRGIRRQKRSLDVSLLIAAIA